jgi:hypothetical protein
VYADEEITNKHILEKIKGMMNQAAFSLFDITRWNANVSLELGMAIGEGLDYYILFNPDAQGEAVPADLGGIDRIQYTSFAELTVGVGKLMRQQFGSPEPEVERTPPGNRVVEQIDALRQELPEVVKNDPGLQIGGTASALGIPVDFAQLVVKPLVGDQLVTRGERRGTRYYLPEDAPPEELREIREYDDAFSSYRLSSLTPKPMPEAQSESDDAE